MHSIEQSIEQSIEHPSPNPRADLSSLTVLRTISWSHNETQKSHGKQIHKPMEYAHTFHFIFAL